MKHIFEKAQAKAQELVSGSKSNQDQQEDGIASFLSVLLLLLLFTFVNTLN